MNLELPFYQLPDAELDAYLDRIDHQLDALFLDDVRATLEPSPAERPADAVDAAA